jgi:DNA-binding LytR/AlgR family response regulator
VTLIKRLMIKLAIHIVEDEAIIAMDMEDILTEQGHTVCASSRSYEEAMEKLPTNTADLFLIDIQLKGAKSGIDLAVELNALGIPHIYVSSVRDRELLALARKTNAVGYILKPFEQEDVFVALQMAIGKIETNQFKQSIFIKTGKGKVQLQYNEILYAEADGHYTDLHTDKRKYTLRGNLKSIHDSLLNSPLFKRVHKSFLVNTSRVEKVMKNEVVLENGKVIPLGKNVAKATK